ncbi:hypothetical protein SUDANB6_05747 [Streptomyces sp. enrichment culture]
MVGLFWTAEGDVYVGAKPSGLAPGVRLSPEGVVALGDGQAGLHPWKDVRDLTVADVPVKTLRRRVGVVTDPAVTTAPDFMEPGSGGADDVPALMAVNVRTTGGDHELAACVAAAVGRSRAGTGLSRAPRPASRREPRRRPGPWPPCRSEGRTREGESPRAAEREALPRKWLGQVFRPGRFRAPTMPARLGGRRPCGRPSHPLSWSRCPGGSTSASPSPSDATKSSAMPDGPGCR